MSKYESDLSQLVYELNRTVPAAKAGASDEVGLGIDRKSSLDPLLTQAAERNASDVILVAGSGVTLRVNGVLLKRRIVLWC